MRIYYTHLSLNQILIHLSIGQTFHISVVCVCVCTYIHIYTYIYVQSYEMYI